ncbi:MAG TPA: MCP four helix bundle domain-containing protein, partial [Ignavibacteriales bacterium]|nr:MCP four helix bundle domain-containing protein [Ignavibacteriales bacterium]
MKTWFNNLGIRKKLLLRFSIVIILLGFVGLTGIKNMQEINDQNTVLYKQVTLPMEEIAIIRYNFQRI